MIIVIIIIINYLLHIELIDFHLNYLFNLIANSIYFNVFQKKW